MPVHDWTRVDAGVFHGFHNYWVTHLSEALNAGLLPAGYYSLPEQHAGAYVADVLTLRHPAPQRTEPTAGAGLAVADAPPRVGRRLVATAGALRRKTVAIRHVTGHRIVALIEIASPANKDRAGSVRDFGAKALDALRYGIHVLVIDVLPPGLHDPRGLAGAVWRRHTRRTFSVPAGRPLTLASFVACRPAEVLLEHLAVGAALPDMPLYLSPERYVNVPLETTYQTAYRGVPEFWRDVIEGRRSPESA